MLLFSCQTCLSWLLCEFRDVCNVKFLPPCTPSSTYDPGATTPPVRFVLVCSPYPAVAQSKNDSYRRAMFDIIVEVSNVLPLGTLDLLYSRIASMGPEDFDQVAIDMVKSFTEHALYIASVHARRAPVSR